jgi:hypothetical protein
MNLAAYNEAGYAPVPLRGGRPAVAGIFANNPSWRYTHGEDARFTDCTVGVLCSARPLSGASGPATLAACSSTWVAGIRWETTDQKLSAELAALVERAAGKGPTRIEGAETLRVFKVDQPFIARRLPPRYFPKERHTTLSYRPHRFEVLSVGAFCIVSGGKWTGGALPEVHRDQLPTLTRDQADGIMSEVERLFAAKGALPWL